MPSRFSGKSLISATPNQVSANLTGETVIYHIPSGLYFGLDSVGHYVWELLQQPRTVHELCDLVVKGYQVEPEQCEQDLMDLLAELAEANLVDFAPNASA